MSELEDVLLDAAEEIPKQLEWECERIQVGEGDTKHPLKITFKFPTYQIYNPLLNKAISKNNFTYANLGFELAVACITSPNIHDTELRKKIEQRLQKPILTDADVFAYLFPIVSEVNEMGDLLLNAAGIGIAAIAKRLGDIKND